MQFCTNTFFRARFAVKEPHRVAVLGPHHSLGSWGEKSPHFLSCDNDFEECWFSTAPVSFPLNSEVQYKYIAVDENDEVVWEDPVGLRTIKVTGSEITIEDDDGYYREKCGDTFLQTRKGSELLSEDNLSDTIQPIIQEHFGAAFLNDGIVKKIREQTKEQIIDPHAQLFVASFELPIRIQNDENGGYKVVQRKSILIPSLYELRNFVQIGVKFIGSPGLIVDDPEERQKVANLLEAHDCIPVWLDAGLQREFLSLCCEYLWNLFHGLLPPEYQSQQPFSYERWQSFRTVNRLFSDTIVNFASEHDLLWIHDFHLLLVPANVVRKLKKINIGLFLHIPFPSSEIFRTLPVREEILRAMLCADLVGFHFFEYARHFLVACKRLLGLDHHYSVGGFLKVEYSGREIMVRIGHAHIPFAKIRKELSDDPTFPASIQNIRQKYQCCTSNTFLVVSVDRCEHLSGLGLKLAGIDHYLTCYRHQERRMVLVQVCLPTRGKQDTLVSESLIANVDVINKQHGGLGTGTDGIKFEYKPIILAFGEISHREKQALFAAADCFLDTSLKAGLNLNPLEFICCQTVRETPLIVSEFCGSSTTLTSVIRINPWKKEEVAGGIDNAMKFPQDELHDKIERDEAYLSANSTLSWAEDFLRDLVRAQKKHEKLYVSWGFASSFRLWEVDHAFKRLVTMDVARGFRKAHNRVLFLDHEGTLAPDRRAVSAVPGLESLAAKGEPPSKAVKESLRQICKDPKNTVVIMSGRDKEKLEEWFGDIENIGLCAEHGFDYRIPALTGHQWHSLSLVRSFDWKNVAQEIMMAYVKRTQGSFLENKGSALVFQYRNADPDFGYMQAKELANALSDVMFGSPVAVMSGKGYVEVKLRCVNKGRAAELVLRKCQKLKGIIDFVIAIGDDRSDEDMFAVVNERVMESGKCNSDPVKLVCSDSAELHTRKEFQQKEVSSFFQNEGFSQGPCNNFSVTIGKKPSKARFFLDDVQEVSDLLGVLTRVH